MFQRGANANQTIPVGFGSSLTNDTQVAQANTAGLTLDLSGGGVKEGDVISCKENDTYYAFMEIDANVAGNGVINHTKINNQRAAVADSSVATISASAIAIEVTSKYSEALFNLRWFFFSPS